MKCSPYEMMLKTELYVSTFESCMSWMLERWEYFQSCGTKVADGNVVLEVILNSVQGTMQERSCVSVYVRARAFIFNWGTSFEMEKCVCTQMWLSYPQSTA